MRSPSQVLGLVGALLGLGMLLVACGCGPLAVSLTILFGQGMPEGAAFQQALALTVLGAGLGLTMAVEGWRLWQGKPSPIFHPRRIWLLWAVLLPLLAAGLLVSLLERAPAYLLPPVNTLTMLLLPALVLGLVGQALRGTAGTWGDVWGGLINGALAGTGLALLVETGLLMVLVLGALVMGLVPLGPEGLESLVERLNDPALFEDPQALLDLLSPAVVLTVLVFVSGVTPLVEEVSKTLGVGLAGLWLRPRPARAFLLGVASGAGFALAENVLNGAVLGPLWAPGILSRLAATLMHCATGGAMSWGWGQLWVGRQPGRLALAFVGAAGLHAVWNGLAVGAAIAGLAVAGRPEDVGWAAVAGLATSVLAGGLLVLAIGTLVAVVWAGRALARAEGQG